MDRKYAFGDVHPTPLDRAYYPRLKDIRWYVSSALRGLSASQLDQVSDNALY